MAPSKFHNRHYAVCRRCGASLPLAPKKAAAGATLQGDVWITPGGELLMAREPEACPSCGEAWDGFVADSGAEARRYATLLTLRQAGQIADLMVHPRYVIAPAFRDRSGAYHRGREYEGDFQYREGHRLVVEDVKGVRTELFDLKAHCLMLRYPQLEFRVVPAEDVE